MLSSQGGQGGQGGATPCAACKLLRRRCAQECPFSPYFSPHEPQRFASVHKIFGASNVSKMLMEVPEGQRADAASSLVYEANARIRDPVYGCMGAISALQQQAHALQAELAAVRVQITRFHDHLSSVSPPPAPTPTPTPSPSPSPSSATTAAAAAISDPTPTPTTRVAKATVGFDAAQMHTSIKI